MAVFERKPLGEALGERGYIRGPFGSALVRGELLQQGIPVYEQQHAITGTREFRFFIGEDKFKELSRFQVRPHDLIVSCSGTVGRISIIQPGDPMGIISQALLILRPDTKEILPKFLYYFLNTREGQHSLTQASHGSVQTNIAPRAVVEQIGVPVPSLPEQEAIAKVLGALDEKIEMNRGINETLETIALAMFKSWFVDVAQAGLPMGWRQGKLGELTGFLGGYAFKSKDWVEKGVPVVKIGSVKPGIVDLNEVSFVSDEVAKEAKRFRLSSGDLLIGMTGYVGEVGLVPLTDNLPLLNQRVGKF